MPADNEDKKAGGKRPFSTERFWGWLYTIILVAFSLYWIVYNPDQVFGVSKTATLVWFTFQTYPGQSSALQFTGTFIVAMGVIATLTRRRGTDYVALSATAGAIVIMAGQAVQITQENPLVLTIVFVLVVYVIFTWLLIGAWLGAMQAYSWLKRRIRSDR